MMEWGREEGWYVQRMDGWMDGDDGGWMVNMNVKNKEMKLKNKEMKLKASNRDREND